ncbi:MAG: ExbD/TolR family protein [Sphingomonas sp.]
MRRPPATQQDQLFSAMNVTPFIDVMLVLLVMLIITIPMQSHIVKIDLPGPSKPIANPELPHKLSIDAAGTLWWDGVQVDDRAAMEMLEAAALQDVDLQVETDPATRYERFDQVLSIVKRAGITRLGFVGNQHMKL